MADIQVRLYLPDGMRLPSITLDKAHLLHATGRVTFEKKKGRVVAAHYRKEAPIEVIRHLRRGSIAATPARGETSVRTSAPAGCSTESYPVEHYPDNEALRVWNLKQHPHPETACGFFVKAMIFEKVRRDCIVAFRTKTPINSDCGAKKGKSKSALGAA